MISHERAVEVTECPAFVNCFERLRTSDLSAGKRIVLQFERMDVLDRAEAGGGMAIRLGHSAYSDGRLISNFLWRPRTYFSKEFFSRTNRLDISSLDVVLSIERQKHASTANWNRHIYFHRHRGEHETLGEAPRC